MEAKVASKDDEKKIRFTSKRGFFLLRFTRLREAIGFYFSLRSGRPHLFSFAESEVPSLMRGQSRTRSKRSACVIFFGTYPHFRSLSRPISSLFGEDRGRVVFEEQA